jgi:hypothetical protein
MKASMLGLAASTVAFGGSSIYLWHQLTDERELVAAVQQANKDLNARLVELEKRRAEFAGPAPGGPATFEGALMAQAGAGPEKGAPPPDAEAQVFTTQRHGPGNRAPEMPPAMLKMMRANVRMQNKRMYFDLQSKLGLTDAQESALLDILTDQQTQGFRNASRNLDPEQARLAWQAEQEKRQADITDLLGATKAAQFEDYQKSMPARSELMNLAQQLESAEIPLNDDQKTRMLAALVDERERIPMPQAAGSQEETMKNYNEWQTDYEKRVSDQARSILNPEQLSTFNEYSQWQREMREQFKATMPPGRGAFVSGTAVNAVAAPVASGSVSFVTTTDVAVPEQKPK